MSTISDSESTIDNGASHRRPSSSPSLYWFTLRTGLCILELVLTSISAVDGIGTGDGSLIVNVGPGPQVVDTSTSTTVNLPTTVTLESTITSVRTTTLVFFFPFRLSCSTGSATFKLL